MTPVDRIIPILKMLASAYRGGDQVTVDNFAVYLIVLQDREITDIKRGVLWCITHHKFFPSVAELLEAIEVSREGDERIPDHDQAWGEVMDQVSAVGSYGIPQFSHQAIAECVRVIGWREICMSEEQSVLRGQFRQIYEQCKRRKHNQALALSTERAEQAMLAISTLADKMKAKALPGGRQ